MAMPALRITRLSLLALTLAQTAFSQQQTVAAPDPFHQQVGEIQLINQDVINGIAMLSRATGLATSVEFPLGVTISSPAPSQKTFTVNVEPGTVTEVLNRLCSLDPTFTWVRDGNRLNVLPRVLANDANYVLNRKISEAAFQNVEKASDAVMKMVGQLPGPREQIAVLQAGPPLNYSRPWTTTLKDVTVREIVDQIAAQLGPTYGWQFGGAQDFRVITFHEGLLPKPSATKR
jgi:hypothetical protein